MAPDYRGSWVAGRSTSWSGYQSKVNQAWSIPSAVDITVKSGHHPKLIKCLIRWQPSGRSWFCLQPELLVESCSLRAILWVLHNVALVGNDMCCTTSCRMFWTKWVSLCNNIYQNWLKNYLHFYRSCCQLEKPERSWLSLLSFSSTCQKTWPAQSSIVFTRNYSTESPLQLLTVRSKEFNLRAKLYNVYKWPVVDRPLTMLIFYNFAVSEPVRFVLIIQRMCRPLTGP